jgi:hypothetical protein
LSSPKPWLGPRQLPLPADDWQDPVRDLAHDAGVIVVGVGSTEGLIWELDLLAESGLLDRTILVFPPLDAADLATRWWFTARHLGPALRCPPDLTPVLGNALVAVVDPDGDLVLIVSNERDEGAYRVALRRAADRIRSTPSEHGPFRRPAA